VTVVRAERIVQHPPEQVFDFVATRHFENHPRWDSELLEMRQTSPGPVGRGTTAHVVRRQGRRRVEGTATVTEYQPCRRAAWDVRFGPFALRQAVDLVPEQDGAATRLRLVIETGAKGPLKLVLPLLRGRFVRTMTRSLETIASLLGQTKP
jgi:Polyketide cyclase / dehydrase and lipid transport